MKKRKLPILFSENAVEINGLNKIETDPQGSYTGRPEDIEEAPVQDADDL